jgi:hypothetical protein
MFVTQDQRISERRCLLSNCDDNLKHGSISTRLLFEEIVAEEEEH